MIQEKKGYFQLDTKHTTYLFHILASGQPEHIYYGAKLNLDLEGDLEKTFAPFLEKRVYPASTNIVYDEAYPALTLEDVCLEASAYGRGDIREPFLEISYEDGSMSSDFIYQGAEIEAGKQPLQTMPSACAGDDEVQQLTLILRERNREVYLHLIYAVFPETDVITRSARLVNKGSEAIRIERLMSTQVDFDRTGLVFTSFNGAWAREMNRTDQVCTSGRHVNQSMTGTSGNRANPFVMLSGRETTEEYGDCYGFNLVYSGNHYEALEVNSYGKSRFVSGINPTGFSWKLEPAASFEAPEAVMSYSDQGMQGLSDNMHAFVRNHIVRGEWQKKLRPVLLNSWEAAYFKFNESKLLKLARAGKAVGVELFVMDDGWFGKRDDDTSSLGDWSVNEKKLPRGIKGLADKINALGMDFGLWVEPEMVNENSDCYRLHPDWVVRVPDQPHSIGRNQMILDYTKREVREYIIDSMSKVFSAGNVTYVKWDMNRIFSDFYSDSLGDDRQGEFSHRYMCGLYEVLKQLTEAFPHILFEGCASGGNRSDLGMLCYMPQFWASDNTDAISRLDIQQGYSYGYPQSVIGAHVSGCPNHQTLRETPLMSRYHVACFGLLGYECNLTELSNEELDIIRHQIEVYKEWREVFQYGRFYRLKDGSKNVDATNPSGSYHWMCVSEDQHRGVLMTAQTKAIPNMVYEKVRTRGLCDDRTYHFYNIPYKVNIKAFGDLVNMISPVHIKKDSLIQHVAARFVKLDGEREDYEVTGRNLNHLGVRLKPAFGGTGFDENTRYYPDYATRMYYMESHE